MSHIKLHNSYQDFDPAFLTHLPALEKAMAARGFDPSAFAIIKSRRRASAEYTVYVRGRSFSVTEPDDMNFLAYFDRLCFPGDHRHHSPVGHASQMEKKRLEAMMAWLECWLDRRILS